MPECRLKLISHFLTLSLIIFQFSSLQLAGKLKLKSGLFYFGNFIAKYAFLNTKAAPQND
jgi:hypothetical protein